MEEQQFNQVQKTIFIPDRSQYSQIFKQLDQEQPDLQQFIQQPQQKYQLINGELIPIFIIYSEIIQMEHTIKLKCQDKYLRSYPSYQETLHLTKNKYKNQKCQQLNNQIIYCKVCEININDDYINEDIDLIIVGTLQIKQHFENIKHILRNDIPKEQRKLIQYEQQLSINFENAFELTYKYFGNTLKMNLQFKLIPLINLEQVTIDFILSKSQMIWKDVGINRIVPDEMLQYITINKQYFNEEEGFIEILLDWPSMLKNQELQPNLPSRRLSIVQVDPVLEITTPLLIKWGNNEITKCYQILWKVKPIQKVGAEITEVNRYQDQQQEFLALKIKITNYSGQDHEIVYCPPSQIFGKKTNQKKEQPLVVLGITLSSEKNLGILQPCQQCDTILRVWRNI